MPRDLYSCAVIGGGPGGLGPLLWAAQHGHLEHWLDQGVALVERSGRLGGTLGRYGINSDSLGGSYLECLEAPGWPKAFHYLREEPTTLEMERYRTTFPPLPLVDRYMTKVGAAMAGLFPRHPASALHLHTTAQSVQLQDDGTVAIVLTGDRGRPRELRARSAVVALGGRQHWQDEIAMPGLTFAQCAMRHVLPSNELLGHQGLRDADRIMREADGRQIVLLGGSHSAYAAAWALLQLPAAAKLAEGQVVILQRRPPRVFYPDRAAAVADSYEVDPGDICIRTQRVNRMGGLRGHGRDIWRQITRRPGVSPESRIVVLDLHQLPATELRKTIEDAALVVPCLGYRSATLPILDPKGRRLVLNADRNGDAVDGQCRLLLSDGTPLPNLFGIGLGTGFRPTQGMGCEPNFSGQANSLWLYQNDIGAVIYHAVQAMLGETKAAA
ncbi:hypothetical protein SAMN02745126_04147 [Enhydrobacter aerosaccus]|uniref:Pyridine nucleotide-disulphide oxidoreductase n=1 Tax=Enhydrobacter aerosaccus TaxID=225324 RepID=A0A1T4RXT7_9HYPH|nr:hypothetical protein [Enhydrobacter aerosaccus]SKA20800.1 hypothetical protein SAMN02745126_04147 [Enhydrobacter aerosaccus]